MLPDMPDSPFQGDWRHLQYGTKNPHSQGKDTLNPEVQKKSLATAGIGMN
jgi:hypothetical protein